MASKRTLRRHRKAENRANSTPRDKYVLEPEAFDEFVALLDAPAAPSPKLVALFARPDRFTR